MEKDLKLKIWEELRKNHEIITNEYLEGKSTLKGYEKYSKSFDRCSEAFMKYYNFVEPKTVWEKLCKEINSLRKE